MVLTAERNDVSRAKPRYAVIDCDIHPNLAAPNALMRIHGARHELPYRWLIAAA